MDKRTFENIFGNLKIKMITAMVKEDTYTHKERITKFKRKKNEMNKKKNHK